MKPGLWFMNNDAAWGLSHICFCVRALCHSDRNRPISFVGRASPLLQDCYSSRKLHTQFWHLLPSCHPEDVINPYKIIPDLLLRSLFTAYPSRLLLHASHVTRLASGVIYILHLQSGHLRTISSLRVERMSVNTWICLAVCWLYARARNKASYFYIQ